MELLDYRHLAYPDWMDTYLALWLEMKSLSLTFQCLLDLLPPLFVKTTLQACNSAESTRTSTLEVVRHCYTVT